jgi:UDPglucose 6-dehydrogenase
MGHHVVTVGDDPAIVARLNKGRSPVHEPKVNSMLRRGIREGRLKFTTDYAEALSGAEFAFIAIDTPVNDQDEPELDTVYRAADQIGSNAAGDLVLCVTAQVPVGTCEQLVDRLHRAAPTRRFDVAYIPEFLRLGEAVDTFFRADRFVIGADEAAVAERVAGLYEPLGRPMLLIGLRSAEMAKHASNTFLATSISFINEMADVCQANGADAIEVAKAMKLDRRIGPYAALSPGLGFAGGTLGRDIRAVQSLARQGGLSSPLMDAVMVVNRSRPRFVDSSLRRALGNVRGRRIGILGLTYKPGTSTLRRSIALEIMRSLAAGGAELRAHDPLADLTSGERMPLFEMMKDAYALARDAEALVLITEFAGLRDLDWKAIAASMRRPLLIDTRNYFDPAAMTSLGFEYFGVGRGRGVPEHEAVPVGSSQ